ncbi:MAG: GHMP kinase [Lentisphaerales bacterium]|jgi:UTP-glucose-1-phosphate uridylyltransferase/mevalonate kinase|nr:MAG: GHMP kinase [Lentisphaerales bacterium]
MRIFVPGRICLFGEHSDWAGGYRRTNAELERGYTIITGTNQGLYADIKPHPTKLIFRSTKQDGAPSGTFEAPMNTDVLLAEAEKGGYFSYMAGVAYQVMTHYRVRGLEIDNYMTDLPIKKGLSSSAAVSVLVARAFNRIYDLKMTIRGEMEYAYMGEITTPSRCGRMDQGCAYGNRPILMTFDGERIDIDEINVPKDMFFVIVDLNAAKDTKQILTQLNRSYPFADDEIQRNVQDYLGRINKSIAMDALKALSAGDAEEVGRIMTRAQAEFDSHLTPACPGEFTAPVLHKLLNYAPVHPYVLGGKGVGSQGDGTAQFIVRNEADQQRVIEILEHDLGMHGLKLIIRSARGIRKAVIPAAGVGTRMFPATKAIKKELFPVIDNKGRIKPVIMSIVEEAVSGGVEHVYLVVQQRDRELFEDFFGAPPPIEHFNKLSKENKEYSEYLMELGRKVTIVSQDVQDGFGHAVFCARESIGDEPFLLLLGDHLYASNTAVSCARQLIDVYNRVGRSVVGLKATAGADIHQFGCATGQWDEPGSVLSISEFYEKPDLEYARKHLHVDGMPEDVFLSVFGQYVLKPSLFEYLHEHISHNIREQGEFQLTSCLDRLRQEDGFAGYVVDGKRFDIGLPESYRQTIVDFRDA